jgi:hypothetical protein
VHLLRPAHPPGQGGGQGRGAPDPGWRGAAGLRPDLSRRCPGVRQPGRSHQPGGPPGPQPAPFPAPGAPGHPPLGLLPQGRRARACL